MKARVRTLEIQTNIRTLKATWSLEVDQDYRAMYNIETEHIIRNLLLNDLGFYEYIIESEEVDWAKEGF